MTRLRLAIALALGCALAAAGDAHASAEKEASYPYEQVWPASVRFLRIDQDVKILEKDSDAGYVLFEIEDDGKMWRGALELVRIEDGEGRPAVRLILRITDRPNYVESLVLKKLVRKLVEELGYPAPPPPRKKKPAPKDDDPPDGKPAESSPK